MNDSFPWAGLTVGQAKLIIRDVVSDEIAKLNLHSGGEPTAEPDVLDMDGAVRFLSSIGLSIPKSRIYKACASRELFCEKLNNRLIFTPDSLIQWVISNISTPETKADAALVLAESARRKK